MMTLREYIKEFWKGAFSGNDIETMMKAGWHSWECHASQLPVRLKNIWELLEPLSSDYILDNFNVWFNNIRIEGDSMADNTILGTIATLPLAILFLLIWYVTYLLVGYRKRK